MGMEVNRFDVVLVTLDPTKGSEIKKNQTLFGDIAKRNES